MHFLHVVFACIAGQYRTAYERHITCLDTPNIQGVLHPFADLTHIINLNAQVIEMADRTLFICFFTWIVRFSNGDIDYSMNGTVYYTAG